MLLNCSWYSFKNGDLNVKFSKRQNFSQSKVQSGDLPKGKKFSRIRQKFAKISSLKVIVHVYPELTNYLKYTLYKEKKYVQKSLP